MTKSGQPPPGAVSIPPPIHLRPTSSFAEQWLQIHVRRMYVHTFHHHTLCVSEDGRVALATGPYLNVLHPPPYPPFRPILNPPLRLVFSAEMDSSAMRKDTLCTSSHLTSIIWASHSLLFLDGAATLTLLRSPLNPDTSNFSIDTTSHIWRPSQLCLPSQSSIPSRYHFRPTNTNIHCFAVARVCYVPDQSPDRFEFSTYLACGTEKGAQFYPLDADSISPKFSQPQSSFSLHSICTVSIACNDGVLLDSGLRTVVALADSSDTIVVYAVTLKMLSGVPVLSSIRMWVSSTSLPPGPVITLSWSLHSTRDAFITLAGGVGNDVIVIDWASSTSTFLTSNEWQSPRVYCVRDAHNHVVTAVQVCYDGCVVSAGMDGRVLCWRVNQTLAPVIPRENQSAGIVASVLQERTDSNEPVMALERTNNAFAVVSVTSTSRQGQEVCDTDIMRKYTGTARRTMMRFLVLPPYGSADDVEGAILYRTERLMNHPSLIDRPLTLWDASHFLHSFLDCASAVVPRLCTRLVEMMEKHENTKEPSTQRFVQRARALLWLARVMSHPDATDAETHTTVNDISRRLRNSLLFVQYVYSLQLFESLGLTSMATTRDERISLDHMCQFLSACRVSGWEQAESGLQLVRKIRHLLEPFVARGESMTSTCSVCTYTGLEVPLLADGLDPGTMWCTGGHSFSRCICTGLPVTEAVPIECAGCTARAVKMTETEFQWIYERGQCALCKGGLVGAHCEAG